MGLLEDSGALNQPIEIPCPHCHEKTTTTLGDISGNRQQHLTCQHCGQIIHLKAQVRFKTHTQAKTKTSGGLWKTLAKLFGR